MYVNQIFKIFVTVGWADFCTNFFLAITVPIPLTKYIKFKEVRGVSTKFSSFFEVCIYQGFLHLKFSFSKYFKILFNVKPDTSLYQDPQNNTQNI